MDKKKILFVFLVLVIFIGCFLRVFMLGSQFFVVDEHTMMIGAMKFTHSSFTNAVSYAPDNPPFGKLILAIPSLFINADYENIQLISPMNYILSYISYDSISKNYYPMKLINALAGVFSILFIYLITKKLFNKEAAIWSAALAAISFDLITYSRILYMTGFIMFFSLGCLFFFLQYVKSRLDSRYFYLLLTYLFLFFAVGVHHVQPWFLIPVLIICQFLFNKDIYENFFVSIGYLATFGAMWVIYSSYSLLNVGEGIASTYTESTSLLALIFKYLGFTFHYMFAGFFLRNNYVYFLVCLILIFLFGKLIYNKKLVYGIKEMVVNRNLKLILVLLFVISFVCLGFTDFGGDMRHLMFLFIPLFIFSGVIISKIVKKKIVLYLVLLLIVISLVQGIVGFPSSTINYSNFGVSSYQTHDYDDSVNKEVLNYLENLGNPIIITNDLNVLIFYRGVKGPLTMPFPPGCEIEVFKEMKKNKVLVLYKGDVDENGNMLIPRGVGEQPYYYCWLFEQIKFDIVKEFGDNLILFRFN